MSQRQLTPKEIEEQLQFEREEHLRKLVHRIGEGLPWIREKDGDAMRNIDSGEQVADDIEDLMRKLGAYSSFREPFQTIPGETFWFLPDIWIVAFPEKSEWFFPEDEAWVGHIKEIYGVYLFDRNERTHLCSFSASYWLHHLYNCPVFVGGEDDTPDDIKDTANQYLMHTEEPRYYDTNSIDAIIDKHLLDTDPKVVLHVGNPGADFTMLDGDTDGERYDNMMDALVEHYSSNWPL